jgi:hypothetical protein
MIILHVEHSQVMRRNLAWCGAPVVGQRITGVDNLLYHVEQPGTGRVCGKCLEAVLAVIGIAVKKALSPGGE